MKFATTAMSPTAKINDLGGFFLFLIPTVDLDPGTDRMTPPSGGGTFAILWGRISQVLLS